MNLAVSACQRAIVPAVVVLALLTAVANAQSIWLEAECGTVGTLWNKPTDANASNSQFITVQPGNNSTASAPTNTAGFATFPLNISQAGTYFLMARVLGVTANDDSFWVRMDGGAWVMWNNWFTGTWAWKQFPNTFSLTAGSHTLTFAYREDGAQLDKIEVSTSSAVPTGTGQAASNCATGTILSVSPTALTVGAAANSMGTFTITSNTSWTAASNQTWLTVNPTAGSNNGTVTVTAQQNTSTSARTAAVTVSATGAPSQTVTVTQSGSGGGGTCSTPPTPTFASLPTNAFLPDPFAFFNGPRVNTQADWTCRRAEIAALAQQFEYGDKPNTPSSAVTSSVSGNTLAVTVNDNGKTLSFNASITYPSTGTAPFPAMIAIGGSSLNNSALSTQGVAVINFPNDQIAQQANQSSRGVGSFYNMFGSGHSAGAMMAWAWGVSRLIDALEKTPGARIDTSRLGVTGCSRNGKGALVAGAFDERIKLTIPQESGSGGSGNWRVSDFMLSQGQQTQTLSEIVGENVWFRANFNQFSSAATKLPFDHHSLIGLVAPRAIFLIDNDILWLGPQSSWTDANAAHMIWQSLGVPDRMGYSLTNGHTHCAFPSSQQAEVDAYVRKFLVGGGTASTSIMRNDPGVVFDQAKWVNWTAPVLP